MSVACSDARVPTDVRFQSLEPKPHVDKHKNTEFRTENSANSSHRVAKGVSEVVCAARERAERSSITLPQR